MHRLNSPCSCASPCLDPDAVVCSLSRLYTAAVAVAAFGKQFYCANERAERTATDFLTFDLELSYRSPTSVQLICWGSFCFGTR